MALANDVVVRVRADEAAAKKSVASVNKTFGGMGAKLKLMFAGMGLSMIAKKGISEAKAQAIAQQKLYTNLTGILKGTNAEYDDLISTANAMQKEGVLTADAITAGMAQLSTFANFSAKDIASLTGVMADLVVNTKGVDATGEDFFNVANMIGKAANGMSGALTRVGVVMNDNQKDLITNGDQMTRNATIMEVLRQNVGSLNKDMAKTPLGKLTQEQNELNDGIKEFGKTLIPIMGAFMEFVNTIINGVGGVENAIGILLVAMGVYMAVNAAAGWAKSYAMFGPPGFAVGAALAAPFFGAAAAVGAGIGFLTGAFSGGSNIVKKEETKTTTIDTAAEVKSASNAIDETKSTTINVEVNNVIETDETGQLVNKVSTTGNSSSRNNIAVS